MWTDPIPTYSDECEFFFQERKVRKRRERKVWDECGLAANCRPYKIAVSALIEYDDRVPCL